LTTFFAVSKMIANADERKVIQAAHIACTSIGFVRMLGKPMSLEGEIEVISRWRTGELTDSDAIAAMERIAAPFAALVAG
jgi:hypothetical protein